MSGIAGRRIWRELCRPAQRKCAPSRLYMGAPSLHLVNAGQFLVHPLQCSGEDLLSVERAFGGAGEASTARIGLAPDLTLLLSCQSALLVAHLPQADAQCPQPLGVVFINRGVVRDRDVHRRVLREVAREAAEWGAQLTGVVDSGLPGPKGNREFFLHLVQRERPEIPDELETWIDNATR